MVLSVNLTDSIIGRMGFDPNYLLVVVIAVLTSFMVARRGLIIVISAAGLAIVANMPVIVIYGVDRDHAAAVLIALLIIPMP